LNEYDKNYTMAVKRVHLEELESTNRYLSELLKTGSQRDELIVVADYQRGGRGQGEHQWHSMPGENLLMSLLLFPAFLSASGQFHISRVASLALIDTLKRFNLFPLIKWPNDILVHRRKVSGILIENGITGRNLSHTIIGIGLNLNQMEFPKFTVEATSLALETGIFCNRHELTDMVQESVMSRYRQLENGDISSLEADYLQHLFLLNQPGGFSSRGEHFTGTIKGLSDQGELIVERDGALSTYGFQEIEYLKG